MNKVKYTEAPTKVAKSLARAKVIKDTLPSPSELVRKTEKERITISIDKHSLGLFKGYAKKHNAKYQTMINDVLGSYADKYLKQR